MGMFTNNMDHGQVAWRWTAHSDGRRNIHLDPTQHAVVTIEAEHHEIHESHMWHYSHLDTDVDIAGPLKINFHTPTEYALGTTYQSATHGGETYVHFAAEIYADAGVTIQFIEGATVSGGSDVSANVVNRNRDHTNTLQTVVKSGVTAADGTILSTAVAGVAGNPSQRESGSARTGQEWILGHDQDYTLVVTASSNDTLVLANFDFYEHIHKDDWDESLIRGAI